MTAARRRPTDWRKRFKDAKPPKLVTLESDFAGSRAGTVMLVGSPGVIANYIARIPSGTTHSIARMRNALARKHGAQSTCPVTTAIYLRVVAEVALLDLGAGKPANAVIPFWRVIDPDSTIAGRLSCDRDLIDHYRALEAEQRGDG
jgi:hypothetical protein